MSEYRESKFMQRLSLVVFAMLIIAILFSINGCSVDRAITDNLEEEKFTQGCKVVQANMNIGYLSQSGQVGVPCKAKCSSKLPSNYCFKYSAKTPYGNCNVIVGKCSIEASK